MFGGLLLIALVAAALCIMLGATELAKRIAIAVVGLALLGPALGQFLSATARAVPGWGIVLVVLAILGALFIVAFKRFVDHRRAFSKWVGESPSSLKHRVEDDL